MITVYPYNTLGHVDHGWLKATHHFSFARYWNPDRTGFGSLLVINDDTIAAQNGFGKHPHDNMEIITYVRSGAITHKDSMGNEGRTGAGDVQVMSAGRGVIHAEHNLEDEDTTLYQIWIRPAEHNVAPRWKAQKFPTQLAKDALPVLVSGQPQHAGGEALYIHQDAAMYGGRVKKGTTITQTMKHDTYVLASQGSFTINGAAMKKGDGAEITGDKTITIHADEDAEILLLDVPPQTH